MEKGADRFEPPRQQPTFPVSRENQRKGRPSLIWREFPVARAWRLKGTVGTIYIADFIREFLEWFLAITIAVPVWFILRRRRGRNRALVVNPSRRGKAGL